MLPALDPCHLLLNRSSYIIFSADVIKIEKNFRTSKRGKIGILKNKVTASLYDVNSLVILNSISSFTKFFQSQKILQLSVQEFW